MNVSARLFATFREGRGKIVPLELEVGATVADAVSRLGIDPSEIAILLVNGLDGRLDAALSDGDAISLFPPVGGG